MPAPTLQGIVSGRSSEGDERRPRDGFRG